MQTGSALVRLAGVHKHYRSGVFGVHALHDINLQVEPAEMVAVCGPSGHGKTTLLNLIGLLESASEGSILVDGAPVGTLSEPARARLRGATIGAVFQSYSLIPVMTAQENVLLPLLLRGRLKRPELKAAQELAAELLARVGLATQVRDFPARLDPGQCQRVAIARALITRPRLVVADEPTSRLDSGSVRMVMDLFAAHQREHNTAFVISTRDQRQLTRANRTLQLNEGRLLGAPADTPRRALRTHP
ncbi:MAG TPA: ATP-binding cassette domain-containing protein [Telluria sp.]